MIIIHRGYFVHSVWILLLYRRVHTRIASLFVLSSLWPLQFCAPRRLIITTDNKISSVDQRQSLSHFARTYYRYVYLHNQSHH